MNSELKNRLKITKPIRSYVIRSRTSKSQKRALDELSSKYAIQLNYNENPTHPKQFFQNHHLPIALEIGFGMGENLLNNAKKLTDFNWIGVETHNAGVGRSFNFAQKNQLDNLKIYHGDIQIFLSSITNQSISWVQLFFPDPWPKKKHHKRRLVQKDFIHELAHKMTVNAKLEIATDWQNYAEQIREILTTPTIKQLFQNQWDSTFSPRSEHRILTNFENKAIKSNREIFDFCLIRK